MGHSRISTSGFAYMATETAVFAVRSAKPCFAGLLVPQSSGQTDQPTDGHHPGDKTCINTRLGLFSINDSNAANNTNLSNL